jgi:aryl-alcohol dehydrogenase-like predicted oxidoreductase
VAVIEEEVVPRGGIGQLAWSPLAQGLLTGKYLPGTPPPAGSRPAGVSASQFTSGALTDNVLERVAGLGEVASDLGLTMSQLAIAWALRNPNVASAIVGATKPEQIAQSATASGIELDDETVERIDRILGPIIERDPRRTPAQPTDYGN